MAKPISFFSFFPAPGGASFSLHPLAVFCLFFSLIILPRSLLLSLFLNITVHEGGHLIAAALLGKKPRSLSVLPFGFTLTYPPAPSYVGEIFIALAGPFCNLLTAFAARLLPISYSLFSSVLPLSLSLFVFNLLPIPSFDGGAALTAFLSLFFSPEKASLCVHVTGTFFLSLLWLAAVYVLFYSGGNPLLLFLSAYLFATLFWRKNGKKT